MKAKRLLPLMLVLFLLMGNAFAQPAIEMFCTSNKAYLDEANSRTWLVELLQEDPQILKQIGKKNPTALGKYKKSVEDANETLKKVVTESWMLSDAKPEFKTKKEILDLNKKGEGENYALLWVNRFQTAQSLAAAQVKSDKPKPVKEEAILSMRLAGSGYRHIGAVNLPSAQPTETELQVALQLLQNHFRIRTTNNSLTAFEDGVKQNAELLKTKTLLVPKLSLQKGMTVEQLKAVYPYEIKIAEQAEIDQAIAGRDEKVCFVQTLPAYGGAKPVNMQLVINAADGKLLARSVPPSATTQKVKRSKIVNEIKIDDFKEFLVYTSK